MEISNLNQLIIPYNSKFFLIKEVGFGKYNIVDVYQIKADSSKIYTFFGVWDNRNFIPSQRKIFSNRMNLQGHEMRLITTPVSRIIVG